jgi:glycosyltransferase involved in cell wall biosynthesis
MSKKLLICTQKVDMHDPVLGFFHQWILLLAQHYENVTVICLEQGTHALPANVTVCSLGKESHRSKLRYIYNFYRYIMQSSYQSVFVHMNEEYVLMAGLIWRLLGKRVTLWRNHAEGTLKTRIAVRLAQQVCCTSADSFTAQYKKTIIMPVGIDDERFTEAAYERNRYTLLSIGRVSPVKRLETIIDATAKLREKSKPVTLAIYGPVLDKSYYETLLTQVQRLNLTEQVRFHGPISPEELPQIYGSAGVFINATNAGSFDKTMLEAVFCGTITIASNENFAAVFNAPLQDQVRFVEGDSDSLADAAARILDLSDDAYTVMAHQLAMQATARHSLQALIAILIKIL